MSQTTKELTIENWQTGVATSPHIGFGEIRNLDVFSTPGVAKLAHKTAKVSGTTVTGLTNWIVKNPKVPIEFFALDSNGRVYHSTDSTDSTDSGDTWALLTGNNTGVGQGLAIWKDYLFVAGATKLDIWGSLTSAKYVTATFVVIAADNTVQASSGVTTFQTLATPVRVSSSITLPSPLAANTTYWTRTAGSTLFRLYPTAADAAADTNVIDIADAGTGTHTINTWYWTLDWESDALDSDTLYHPMLVSKNDGKLYIGAGKYVTSIDEAIAPFVPGTGASYTFTQQALDLPDNYRIKCLSELGEKLELGTWVGTSIGDTRIADIFTWDMSSPSYATPIILEENGVNAMLTIDNLLYIQAGIEGKFFISNGVQISPIGKVPNYITGQSYSSPGAVANYKGKPYFGMSYGNGVWSIDKTSKGYALNLAHTISTGNTTDVSIGSILPVIYNNLLIGWRDASTYGIDKVNNAARYTGYAGFAESAFYRVGTFHHKKQFMEVEFQLAKPLVVGQGVKIEYRTNLTSSFTTIGTYTFATIGAVGSFVAPATITPCEFVQVKVSLAPGTFDADSSPEIRTVILR